jgi:hypothetical protein
MFFMGSRYYALPLLKWEAKDGSEVGYVSRRFLPSGDEFDLLLEHRVAEGERLDTITAQYLDDPEQFWRICDANEVNSPFELTDPVGRKIRITLPQGIPGPRNA